MMSANLQKTEKEKYWQVFLITFSIIILVVLPVLVYNKGIFLYYGDYNSQQIPFYYHAHEAISNGNIFWDWGTDLGSNFMGSYSFYLLGSPFFWLTLPFPSEFTVYMMPWLLALKTGVAGVTSYAFARRFIKSKNACVIAGILYALSGFQLYNIFFNHFHDVVAFFPLLLIALEERVNNNRRGVFALAVALCAMINYFFFTGQVTFLFIYFIFRCSCEDFNIDFKKFMALAFEAVVGIMLACFLLLPSVLAVVDNPRVESWLCGYDIVVYDDKFRIFRIIQSFFMLSDPPARSNLFSSNTARWASIAGYLPMFSMAGVIAFFKDKRKHWMKSLILVCIVCAFIPFLNTSFYAFNSAYYARWYYMPILIMCVMTAYVIDNKEMSIKKGIPLCVISLFFFIAVGLIPSHDEKDKSIINIASLAEYPLLFWLSVVVTAVGLFALCYLAYYSKKDKGFYKKAITLTTVSAFICTATIVWYGIAQGPYQEQYISESINGKSNITLDTGDEYFRVDISQSMDNYPMFWGYSSMRAFHSVVPGSIMTFYKSLGITRDVASRIETSRYPLRGLLSVKYYFNRTNEKQLDMPGFNKISTQNNFDIYENENYIPMGFAFEYYITDEQLNGKSLSARDGLLLKGLMLDEAQIEKYQDVISPLPVEEYDEDYTIQEYTEDCNERIAAAAYFFEEDSKGFTAKINLEKESLVFFSVPYDKGFSATVNGEAVDIEVVDNGLMAVLCPAGQDVEIRFDYMTPGLITGILITFLGAALLIAYVLILNRKSKNIKAKNICYDYESIEDTFSVEAIDTTTPENDDIMSESESIKDEPTQE